MTTAPSHPALGLPEEKLRELASVDFHAGAGTTCQRESTWCPCEGSDVVGDFAVRFITGQAQLSTDTAGRAASVLAVDPHQRAPRIIGFGSADDDVLAGLVLRGSVEQMPCTEAACTEPQPHITQGTRVTGLAVLGHTDLGDTTVLQLLGFQLADLLDQRPTAGEDDQTAGGRG